MGRQRLFQTMARRFDSNKARAESDGAFIAAMLDTSNVAVGKEYWIHRDSPNEIFPAMDPRRNWRKGWIVNVDEEMFTVICEKDKAEILSSNPQEKRGSVRAFSLAKAKQSEERSIKVHPVPENLVNERRGSRRGSTEMARRLSIAGGVNVNAMRIRPEHAIYTDVERITDQMSKEEVLEKGRRIIRCIDWDKMSLALLKESKGGPETYALSRFLNKGEQIDYFMSHSWYDSSEQKWLALQKVAAKFHR